MNRPREPHSALLLSRQLLAIGLGLMVLPVFFMFVPTAEKPAPNVEATTWSGNIQDLSYTYDAVGNITQIADTSITPTAKTLLYEYDSLNRLRSAVSSGFVPGDFREDYYYDSLGNLTYKSDIGTLTYGGTGFPGPHAVTNAQGQGYLYDNNGNVTQDDVNVYTWNIKNQLESVTTPSTGASWTYTYDPFGTRLTSTNETTGETTIYVSPTMEVRPDEAIYYVYAGSQRVASVSVPHESGTSGDLSTLVLGDPTTDGTLTYYHQDHLGGTQLTTDQYGVVTQVYDYYPYGSELLDENLGAPDVPYSFTGKEFNDDTGLYYFEARWYDPTIGRFMSGDPMQYVAPEKLLGDPQAFNYYAYSRNNPVNMVDPSGENPLAVFLVALVVSVASDFISDIPIANAPDVGQATVNGAANGGNPTLGFVVGLVDPSPAGEVKAAANAIEQVTQTIGTKVDNLINSYGIKDKMSSIVQGAYLTDKTASIRNWDKFGNYDTAMDDLVQLAGGKENIQQSADGLSWYTKFDDGTTASVYPSSKSGGNPTLQIDRGDGVDVKIRYDD